MKFIHSTRLFQMILETNLKKLRMILLKRQTNAIMKQQMIKKLITQLITQLLAVFILNYIKKTKTMLSVTL